jgi:tRNA(Arg) A34 adenosine deaminase TadA
VVVGSNDETRSPLLHGEIACLERFWALPDDRRPDPKACLFLSSHEPCSLCLSAITWSGFDNFSYLFSYEETRDAFAIPHDLRILREVFGVEDGGYRAENAYWRATDLQRLIEETEGDRTVWRARVTALKRRYGALSDRYQQGKGGNVIPLD